MSNYLKSVLTLTIIFILNCSVASAGITTLRMSSWIPPSHPLYSEVMVPWADNIGKATEGRVKVKILKKSVGSPPQQFDMASKAVADIVYGCHSYTPGRFMTHGFVELPNGGENAIATSMAYWRTYQKFMAKADEHKGVHLLSLFTHGPGILFTNGKEIKSIDENKGLKIRGGGVAATRVVDALNATSIAAPISKAAEMIANGVVDGIMLDKGSLFAFKFDKYMKYAFSVDGGLYNVSWFLAINENSWNKISEKDKLAIEKISGENFARMAGESWQRGDEKAKSILSKNGTKIDRPNPGLKKELNAKFGEYKNEWLKSVEKYGIDGKMVIDAYHKEVADITLQLKSN
ncbi:MAG: TRAP transporter substrate-binding protein [Desulfobacteraceae bacterium]|nr:TRAP transporter substrate-binding protein [Desulfobacteraceae bacterium]